MGVYTPLLQPKRYSSTTVPGRTLEWELESDRSRIVYSPAFRRMQQKAQVFSLIENPEVRARMTHSLEVSDVGRKAATRACGSLEESGIISPDQVHPFILAVENGCLTHDIGNPPFGHLGEAAIKKWFNDNWEPCCRLMKGSAPDGDDKNWAMDLLEFDGNPHGMRILLRLQGIDVKENKGMNLTWTQVLTSLKYVRCSGDTADDGVCKKPGFFRTESSFVKRAQDELQWAPRKRFPLAYLVEAADDISYCISDFEDGIEMGVIDQRTFLKN